MASSSVTSTTLSRESCSGIPTDFKSNKIVSLLSFIPNPNQHQEVSNRHSLHLPSLSEVKMEENKVRRRHSYTGESGEENKVPFPSPLVASPPPPPKPQPPGYSYGGNFDERKARYKLQLRHFKRRRRYSDWFFTLYEFDKPILR